MKKIKTYKAFNESLRDKLRGKSDDDIRNSLLTLDIETRLIKIKSMGLDSSFLPPREEIEEFLKGYSTEQILDKNKTLGLDSSFLPPREEIEKYLPFKIRYRLEKIKTYNLDNTFLPPKEEIKDFLMGGSISNWINSVSEYGLDRSFLPTDSYIKETIGQKYEDDEELKDKAEALLQHLKDENIDDEDMTIHYLEPDSDFYDMAQFTNLKGSKYESYAVGTDDEADKAAYDNVDNLIDEISYSGFAPGFASQYIDGDDFASDYYENEEDNIRDDWRNYGIDAEDELNSSAQREVDGKKGKIEDLEEEIENLDDTDDADLIEGLEEEIEGLEEEIEDIKEDEDNYDIDEDSLESYCDDAKKDIADDPIDYLKNLGYDEDGINDAVERYIDRDEFIKGVIESDGRAHNLSSYDGAEYNTKYNDTWYYIYRTS